MGRNPVITVTMRRVAILSVLALLVASGCSRSCRTAHEPKQSRNDVTAVGTSAKAIPTTRQGEPRPPPEVEKSHAVAPLSGERPEKAAPESSPTPQSDNTTPVRPGIAAVTAAPALDEPVPKTEPEAALQEPVDGIKEPPLEEPTEQQPPEQNAKQKETVEPPLDLDLLEQRLRETKAIGVFTKLALKNQVDDLLDKFRDFYQGRSNTSLAQLRQPYEMLILKVLALLQDSDPALARDLVESREAIWKVLSDREKFTSI